MTAAFFLNIVLIVLEVLGLSKRPGGFQWKMFAFYTQLSNTAALVSSVLFLILRGAAAAVYLRYLAVCMLLMTVFVTLCILVPMGGGFRKMMLSGSGLYHHTLCPVVCVISYVFFEPHVRVWLLPSLVTLGYGIVMMILNALRKTDGPYPFFRVHNQSKAASFLWMAALFCVIAGISYAVTLAGNV